MVFNHTSTQHALVSRGAEQRKPLPPVLYLARWRTKTPPNNWRSKFGGSAWRWHAESVTAPFASLCTRTGGSQLGIIQRYGAELKKVCEFWADRGSWVAPGCGESDLQNTCVSLNTLMATGVRFIPTGHSAHEFLHEMNRDVFTPRGLMTVGEMSSTSLEHRQRYAALTGSELSMTFTFIA